MTFHFENSGKLKILTDEELAAYDGDSAVIVYDDGTLDDGSHYWLYIAVKPSKYSEFIDKTAQCERITYNDYGTILKYGFDEVVPDAVKEEMKQHYGCDDSFLAVLTEDFKKAQTDFLKQREDKRINDIVAMLKKKQNSN